MPFPKLTAALPAPALPAPARPAAAPLAAVTAFTCALLAAPAAQARDQIRIVGSSTVFPFSTVVAEQFGRTTDYRTPVVEATGTGGGMKLFCAGVGISSPDIVNASRRMKASEWEMCGENGVSAITEVEIGFDGIVLANAKAAPDFAITRADLWRALAEAGEKPARWSDVAPALAAEKIEVLGPPPSSGTRDAFEELVMIEGCIEAGNAKDFCHGAGREIRRDGAYVDAGENDNLIVAKLEANPVAVGIFGFSFLDQNTDRIKGALIDGVAPEFENIADGSYPVSRGLYFYIKKAHVGVVPGIAEYAALFLSDQMMDEDEGALIEKGLIPLPGEELEAMRARLQRLEEMTGEGLH